MESIAIIGIGNPLHGDGGAGYLVIEELRRRGVPDTVQVRDGGVGGINIIYDLEGFTTAIFIDAVNGPRMPGVIIRREGEAVWRGKKCDDAHTSLHQGDFLTALILAQKVGLPLPPHLVFYGVQVGDLTPCSCHPSPAVAVAIPLIADMVEKEIKMLLDVSPESHSVCSI